VADLLTPDRTRRIAKLPGLPISCSRCVRAQQRGGLIPSSARSTFPFSAWTSRKTTPDRPEPWRSGRTVSRRAARADATSSQALMPPNFPRFTGGRSLSRLQHGRALSSRRCASRNRPSNASTAIRRSSNRCSRSGPVSRGAPRHRTLCRSRSPRYDRAAGEPRKSAT